MLAWLAREAAAAGATTPAFFEVSFGIAGARGRERAAFGGAARDRPRRRAQPARLGQDRPHRPHRRRRPRAPRLQDGQGAAQGRRRPLQGRPPAPDPLLHPGGGQAAAGRARGEGLPRLRRRRPAGADRPRERQGRSLQGAAPRPGGRHRPGPLRPGADGLRRGATTPRCAGRAAAQGPARLEAAATRACGTCCACATSRELRARRPRRPASARGASSAPASCSRPARAPARRRCSSTASRR